MNDVECPYCGAAVEINHDDGYGYEENRLHEQECPECEKRFAYTIYVSYSHTAYQADCLNGSPHKYEKTRTHPPEFATLRCADCGDEKPLDFVAR